MFKKTIYLSLLVISFFGCKKEDNSPTNNAAPQYTTGGFIKGTVSGTRANGISFTIPFEYNIYSGPDRLTNYDLTGGYSFDMNRYGIAFDGYCGMSFDFTSTQPPYGITENYFYGNFYQSLGQYSQFMFQTDVYNNNFGNSYFTIDSFSYNDSTKIATGSFSTIVDGTDNNTGNPAVIIGTFQSLPLILSYERKQKDSHYIVGESK